MEGAFIFALTNRLGIKIFRWNYSTWICIVSLTSFDLFFFYEFFPSSLIHCAFSAPRKNVCRSFWNKNVNNTLSSIFDTLTNFLQFRKLFNEKKVNAGIPVVPTFFAFLNPSWSILVSQYFSVSVEISWNYLPRRTVCLWTYSSNVVTALIFQLLILMLKSN